MKVATCKIIVVVFCAWGIFVDNAFQIITAPIRNRDSSLYMGRRLEKGTWEKLDDMKSDETYDQEKYYQEPPVPVNPRETAHWHPEVEEELMIYPDTMMDEDEDDGAPPTPEELRAMRDKEIEEEKLVEALLQEYPDLPEICIDDLEDVEMEPIMGETRGCEAPLDAPWRLEAEKIMKKVTENLGLELYDVLWSLREVEVTITAREDDQEGLTVEKISDLAKELNLALEEREDELGVLDRHELIVATPGSPDVLTTERQFQAFKGFDVIVSTCEPTPWVKEPRKIEGKLVERKTHELILNVKGRTVTIPTTLVDEVRLPEAMYENGDPAAPAEVE